MTASSTFVLNVNDHCGKQVDVAHAYVSAIGSTAAILYIIRHIILHRSTLNN